MLNEKNNWKSPREASFKNTLNCSLGSLYCIGTSSSVAKSDTTFEIRLLELGK